MIDLSTGEVPAPPETRNYILLDSDGKIWMQYIVSDIETDVVYGKRGTMAFNLTTSETSGFEDPDFLGESGGMVGYQAIVGIPKYYMIVKYDLKE